MPRRPVVPGEDAPVWVVTLLGLGGVLGAIIATVLFSSEASARGDTRATEASAPTVATASVSTPTPTPTPPAPSSSASAPAAAAPASCAPIIIPFAFGIATIDAADLPTVDVLGAWLVETPDANVIVHGHADALGNEGANLALSRVRAMAIATRLVAKGVERSRITVRGFGAYQPVEGAPEEAASNRRAVVYVKKVAGTSCPGVER